MPNTTRRYLSALARTTRVAHDWAQAVIAVLSLAVSVLTGWRFGVAWGVAMFLACALLVTVVTGWRLARDMGTRIPPGWNAIIHGVQDGEGEWIPPGYRVVMGTGLVTDDQGNVVQGRDCRVVGGSNNNVSGVGRVVRGSGNTIIG